MSTEINMMDLLQATVDEGSSDLHIRVGVPPMLRIHGSLTPLDSPPLKPEDTEALARSITAEDKMHEIEKCGGADFALEGARVCEPVISGGFRVRPECPACKQVLCGAMRNREVAGAVGQHRFQPAGRRVRRVGLPQFTRGERCKARATKPYGPGRRVVFRYLAQGKESGS